MSEKESQGNGKTELLRKGKTDVLALLITVTEIFNSTVLAKWFLANVGNRIKYDDPAIL